MAGGIYSRVIAFFDRYDPIPDTTAVWVAGVHLGLLLQTRHPDTAKLLLLALNTTRNPEQEGNFITDALAMAIGQAPDA